MATSLAAEIQNQFNVDASLTPGDQGVFDVVVDGKLVFSKYEEGRFPEAGEIVERISRART